MLQTAPVQSLDREDKVIAEFWGIFATKGDLRQIKDLSRICRPLRPEHLLEKGLEENHLVAAVKFCWEKVGHPDIKPSTTILVCIDSHKTWQSVIVVIYYNSEILFCFLSSSTEFVISRCKSSDYASFAVLQKLCFAPNQVKGLLE